MADQRRSQSISSQAQHPAAAFQTQGDQGQNGTSRAATVRNVDAARRGRPHAPHQGADRIGPAHVRLPESDELSTLSEYLQRIIDNTDTRLLDEEITERRKAIHEFLMLDRSGEAQE